MYLGFRGPALRGAYVATARTSPAGILASEANEQRGSLRSLRTSARPTPCAAVVLLGDEFPIPPKDRVGCDQFPILLQQLATQGRPLGGEWASLIVVEAGQPAAEPGIELLAENAFDLRERTQCPLELPCRNVIRRSNGFGSTARTAPRG